jgi:hypothetical protein
MKKYTISADIYVLIDIYGNGNNSVIKTFYCGGLYWYSAEL